MKLKAPESISHFEFDNVDYQRDDDGNFDIRHPDHLEKARMLGAHDDDGRVYGQTAFAAPVPTETEEKLAEAQTRLDERETDLRLANERNDDLQRRLEAMERHFSMGGGTNTASGTADTSGGTSSGTGGTGSDTGTGDVIGAALASNPDFAAMNRDEKVAWLKTVNVTVSSSISKENAQKAIDDLVNEYNASKQG